MPTRTKHPIQKIRRPLPPPTKVKPNKRREEAERLRREKPVAAERFLDIFGIGKDLAVGSGEVLGRRQVT